MVFRRQFCGRDQNGRGRNASFTSGTDSRRDLYLAIRANSRLGNFGKWPDGLVAATMDGLRAATESEPHYHKLDGCANRGRVDERTEPGPHFAHERAKLLSSRVPLIRQLAFRSRAVR